MTHSGESDAEHNQVRLLAMRCGCTGVRPAHRACWAPVLQGEPVVPPPQANIAAAGGRHVHSALSTLQPPLVPKFTCV